MRILELWQHYPVVGNAVAVAAAVTIIIIIIIIAIMVGKTAASHGSDPDPADTENQVSILREKLNCSPEVWSGNISKSVQEGHDQNVHSTLTVCIIDSVPGGNEVTFRHQPTEQEEVREPIKTENSFNSFIRDYVIPTFCLQRRDKQFAVLFLSGYNECNIHKTQFGEST